MGTSQIKSKDSLPFHLSRNSPVESRSVWHNQQSGLKISLTIKVDQKAPEQIPMQGHKSSIHQHLLQVSGDISLDKSNCASQPL